MPATNHTVALSDATLHYVTAGEAGPLLLLLHGLSESANSYASLLDTLALACRVYAVDLRGQGSSSHSAGKYRLCDYVQDIGELITHEIGEPLILAGHSLGSMVAAGVAARHGDRVIGVLLEEPPFFALQEPAPDLANLRAAFAGVRERLYAHQRSRAPAGDLVPWIATWPAFSAPGQQSTVLQVLGETYVTRFAGELHAGDPATFDPFLDGSLFDGFAVETELPRITCPTHIIAGSVERGSMLDQHALDRLTQLIPHLSYVVWDAGHEIHAEKPQAFSAELLAFVRRLS
jgi:pimeloyl-ACP methyl ester carboxylesterase